MPSESSSTKNDTAWQELFEQYGRSDLESLDYGNLYSESAALNYAAATGLLAEVIGEACELTVSGRMSSRDFGFVIRHAQQPEHLIPIQVRNAQIEIDGGYEGQTKLALIEAKKTKCEDFLIRQMYYPYRAWADRISKTVVPIFMTFSNDVFSFFVYEFQEQGAYNSLMLLQQRILLLPRSQLTSATSSGLPSIRRTPTNRTFPFRKPTTSTK